MLVTILLFVCTIDKVILTDLLSSKNPGTNSSKEDKINSLSVHNGSVQMSRITQPSDVKLERNFDVSDTPVNGTVNSKVEPFKPSPPVEMYEYNKIPVKPAVPEAKSFNDERHNSYGRPTFNTFEQNNWQQREGLGDWRSTGDSWNNKVKFPSNSGSDSNKITPEPDQPRNINNYPNPTDDYAFNRPNNEYSSHSVSGYHPHRPSGYSQNKISGSPVRDAIKPLQHKTWMDYNLLEKPPYYEEEISYPISYESTVEYNRPDRNQGYGVFNGEYGGGYGSISHGGSYGGVNHVDGKKSPWKKIIKFLATIIPIGLLISALTPNIIQIQNSTDSTHYNYKTKYRNDESTQEFSKRLSTSIQYFNKLNKDECEDKVLCELLVSASFSKNAEDHVKALLDNFVKQEDLTNKKEDLLKIFEAVRNEDCSPIRCESSENPT